MTFPLLPILTGGGHWVFYYHMGAGSLLYIILYLLFIVLYCNGSITASDSNRLNKFIKRVGSVISSRLDNFEIVAERGGIEQTVNDHGQP